MAFSTSVPAKCVLSGGYFLPNNTFSVVCPLENYQFRLKYTPAPIKTIRTICGDGFNSTQIILWSVIEEALTTCGENPKELTGLFDISNSIPAMSGLGFSAAISVAVANWMSHLGIINQYEIFNLALTLESTFHKGSSGIDVAGVMSKNVVVYSSEKQISELKPTWKPILYVSDSKDYQFTANTMQHIKSIQAKKPQLFADSLNTIKEASQLLIDSLTSEAADRFSMFSTALKKSNQCYYDWEVVSEKLDSHIQQLNHYANATKIVGAGYGGFVLSLWENTPPATLPFELVPVYL